MSMDVNGPDKTFEGRIRNLNLKDFERIKIMQAELNQLRAENMQWQRIYNNACVMRDHYKAKLDKLEVKS